MKISNDTILIMAAAGIGLFFMTRMSSANANKAYATSTFNKLTMPKLSSSPTVTEIQNDDVPGQPGFGWHYYSDGTAIGPDGSYYSNGQKVWSVT